MFYWCKSAIQIELDSDGSFSGWKQGEFLQYRMGYNPPPPSNIAYFYVEISGHDRVRMHLHPVTDAVLCSSFCSLFKKSSLLTYLEYTVTASTYTKLFLRTRCFENAISSWSYFALVDGGRASVNQRKHTEGSRDINIEKKKHICISAWRTRQEVLAASSSKAASSLPEAAKVH